LASYQVDGTSLMSWSLRVEAESESDASEHAVRIARCLSGLQWDHALRDARHDVVSSRRLIESRTQDQPDLEWAARMRGK
jgi:hypothetical protein